jgi:REP element-mobilizing transposase RayT
LSRAHESLTYDAQKVWRPAVQLRNLRQFAGSCRFVYNKALALNRERYEKKEQLKVMFEKVCTDFEAQLVEMNGEAEHVHLLIHYPPKHSVSSMVNSLQGVSSRLLVSIEKRYWKNVLWSPS